jgi:hypothetical protein
MPNFDWQSIAAAAAVAWALYFVARAARRTILARRTSGSCGSCGTCPTKSPQQVVSIQNLPRANS